MPEAVRPSNLAQPVETQVAQSNAGSDPRLQPPRSLTALVAGTRASVVEIRAPADHRARLLELGLVPGTLVELVRLAPLGGPVEVRVRGSQLVLRRDEADHIWVQPWVGPAPGRPEASSSE